MFVENKNKLDILECEVLDEIIRENGDTVSVQRFGDNIFITTEVDGEFQISVACQGCAKRGHVIMVDSSIRQNIVDTVIEPQIQVYETKNGGAMLNPKLIYFKLD